MKRKLIVTALLVGSFLFGSAAIENLGGKWTGSLKTDGGEEYTLLYNFKIEGSELTGTAKTPKGNLPINDGKITGDSFSFNVLINNMEIDHTGKFYGDSLGVDLALGDQKAHVTLKRANQ